MCVRVCVCVCVCAGAREGVLCRGCCGGGGGGGGGGSQFLHINITPNRNRKSCYSLLDRVRQQLAILQMGIGYNEFITMFYIQVTFKLKNP